MDKQDKNSSNGNKSFKILLFIFVLFLIGGLYDFVQGGIIPQFDYSIWNWTGRIIYPNDMNTTVRVNNLEVKGNLTYYAGMYSSSEIGIAGMTLNTTYQKVNFTNSFNINGFNFVNNQTTLTLVNPYAEGVYQVIWRTEKVGINNHIYFGKIFINEVEQNATFDRSVGQVSNALRMLGFGFIDIHLYDNITLRLKDFASTSTPLVYIKNVNLIRVGG